MNPSQPPTKAMPKEYFLRLIEQNLQLAPQTLEGNKLLCEIEEWDSLAVLSFLAMADSHAGVVLSGEAVAGCSTVDDLYSLVR
jgi:acyl carrier protein